MQTAQDRIEIEDLRRLYAQATDQIGVGTPDQVSAGRATYHTQRSLYVSACNTLCNSNL